jgi:hypothetical protein
MMAVVNGIHCFDLIRVLMCALLLGETVLLVVLLSLFFKEMWLCVVRWLLSFGVVPWLWV